MPDGKKMGKVTYFDPNVRWGRISATNPGEARLHVHMNDVTTGETTLQVGQMVAYFVGRDDRGRPCAVKVEVLDNPAITPGVSKVIPGERERKVGGLIKFFDTEGNFGFISREGSEDVFVHGGDLAKGMLSRNRSLEGRNVVFDVVQSERGPRAIQVRPAKE